MTKSNSLESKNKIPTSSKQDNNINEKEIDSEEDKRHLSVFKESCKNELVKSKNTLIYDDLFGKSKSDVSIDQSKSDKKVKQSNEIMTDQSKSDERVVDQSKSYERVADQSQSDAKVVDQSNSDASRYTLTCPVCFNSKFDSELNLNQHIDICLNKEFIEDALKSRQEL